MLGRWASRSPSHDPSLPFSAASLLLSLRTMLDPARAEGLVARIGLRLGAETFVAHLADGRIRIVTGPLDGADVTFTGTPPRRRRRDLWRPETGSRWRKQACSRIEGDRALAERFVTLFPLPRKAAAPA